jgi:predicted dinucleotide-binding enzyme
MKIAIIGDGSIGENLGKRWSECGYHVRFGSLYPERLKAFVAGCGPNADATDIYSACELAEVIVLSVPWLSVDETLKAAGDLHGKILLDTTNAFIWDNGPTSIVSTSCAQLIASKVPDATVVKGFNAVGAHRILNPLIGGLPADVFICGDNLEAKEIIENLSEEIGFRAIDMGVLRNACLIENLALIWIQLSLKGNLGHNIAFKLLS